jgi:hypothetical protein
VLGAPLGTTGLAVGVAVGEAVGVGDGVAVCACTTLPAPTTSAVRSTNRISNFVINFSHLLCREVILLATNQELEKKSVRKR